MNDINMELHRKLQTMIASTLEDLYEEAFYLFDEHGIYMEEEDMLEEIGNMIEDEMQG